MFIVPPELYPPPHKSWMHVVSELPPAQREEVMNHFAEVELDKVMGDWFFTARREQIPPPGDWFIWLLLSGRGFGKTWTGANTIISSHQHGGCRSSCIVAATANDLRQYCIEGEAGILSLAPDDFYPHFTAQPYGVLHWPNGTKTLCFSSEKPQRIRSGNFELAWCDEYSYWKDPKKVWDTLMFALRVGKDPRVIVSMTPRPIPEVRALVDRIGIDAVLSTGTTYDNRINLAPSFYTKVVSKYENTRLGRQEIYGEILEEIEGALWSRDLIDNYRKDSCPKLLSVVIAVDPATTAGEEADNTGIIVSGLDANKHAYVVGDHTINALPGMWANKVASLYHFYSRQCATVRVVAESNQGGKMVQSVIHNVDSFIPVTLVHASVGKVARAEPVSMLYEQGKVHHVGFWPKLEDEMCTFIPGEVANSPDRLDALVYGLTELLIKPRARAHAWGKLVA